MKYIACNIKNTGGNRAYSAIKYIVVHYTANNKDTAEGNANYFKNNVVKASAHYFVDDKEVVMSVPDNVIAYSVGGSKYKNTKGGTLYGKCTNSNSISVELCNSVSGVPEKTRRNAQELIIGLMEKYNIPKENVIRHYDVTGKLCPKPYVEKVSLWNAFKKGLEKINMEELENLKKRVSELEAKAKVYDSLNDMPEWIKNITEWGLENGIISGTGTGLGMTQAKAETLVMVKNATMKVRK